MPDAKPVHPVVSGTSFTDAPILKPGSYSDTPTVGESILYGIQLEPGQRLRTTVTAPSSKSGWDLGPSEVITVASLIYTPSRVPLTKQGKLLQGNRRGRVTAYSPEVRVRNREIFHGSAVTTEGDARQNASYASSAGVYYVSVQLKPQQKDLRGRVAAIRLDLAVDGAPKGQPQYADGATSAPPSASGSSSDSAQPTAEPTASEAPPPTDSGGSGIGPLVAAAGIGATVVALGGLAVGLLRRRSRAATTTRNGRA